MRALLEHLAARKCVDAGDAAFLRAACGLFADRAARAAPGRRPVLARDEEHAAAQCFYDLIGAKVLRDACAGHVVSEAARKRRAKHFEARDGFALFAAPLVLRDRTAADEPPPPLVGRRDLLETLTGAAGAAARLARRSTGPGPSWRAFTRSRRRRTTTRGARFRTTTPPRPPRTTTWRRSWRGG